MEGHACFYSTVKMSWKSETRNLPGLCHPSDEDLSLGTRRETWGIQARGVYAA